MMNYGFYPKGLEYYYMFGKIAKQPREKKQVGNFFIGRNLGQPCRDFGTTKKRL